MVNTLEVFLWGTRIGYLYLKDEQTVVSFEYDKDFLKK